MLCRAAPVHRGLCCRVVWSSGRHSECMSSCARTGAEMCHPREQDRTPVVTVNARLAQRVCCQRHCRLVAQTLPRRCDSQPLAPSSASAHTRAAFASAGGHKYSPLNAADHVTHYTPACPIQLGSPRNLYTLFTAQHRRTHGVCCPTAVSADMHTRRACSCTESLRSLREVSPAAPVDCCSALVIQVGKLNEAHRRCVFGSTHADTS